MDITSLRRRIDRLIHIHSSSLSPVIGNSGFSCMRCGWCCRRNFDIKITENISRPSNAISIFSGDIRGIIKMTGRKWDEVAEPDIYSCFSDGDDVMVIGWILKRNDEGDCVFYRMGECTIYSCRPMICRCYPFFMGEEGIEIMHCEGLGKKMKNEDAMRIAQVLKRYEIKKLQSYIGIIGQVGDKLSLAKLRTLPRGFSGEILVCDNEGISRWTL
jgi:Fe-S-cluster containining protein